MSEIQGATNSVFPRARKLQQEGRLEEAIALFQEAIQKNPNFSWNYYLLGEVLVKQEKLENAITELNKGIELNPKQTCFYYGLGKVLTAQGKFGEGIAHFRTCLQKNMHFSSAQKELELALQKQDKQLSNKRLTRKLLILGCPRCGSGYMSQIFQKCNLEIGHEVDMKDGMSCWQFAVFARSWLRGSRSDFKFKYIAHHVRNPKTSIPSILMLIDDKYATDQEKAAMNYIYKYVKIYLGIDIEAATSNLDKAILSYLSWNQIVENTGPDVVFKVESCEADVLNFINKHKLTNVEKINIDQVFDINLKSYNNSIDKFLVKEKPKITESDWLSVSTELRGWLNSFCDKYDYPRIYNDALEIVKDNDDVLKASRYINFQESSNALKTIYLILGKQQINIKDVQVFIEQAAQLKQDLFFVSIGAMDGVRYDFLHKYIKKYRWSGLLVEPLEDMFLELKKNYEDRDNLLFENSAITEKSEIRDMYRIPKNVVKSGVVPDCCDGISSLFLDRNMIGGMDGLLYNRRMSEELYGSFKEYIVKEKVNCISFAELIFKHNFEKIDLLKIDTEGYDYQIFSQIDLRTFMPFLIVIEVINLTKNEFDCLVEKLINHDYKWFMQGLDVYALKW